MKPVTTAPSPRPSPQGETTRGGARGQASSELFKAARTFCKGLASTARLMVGVPDYEAYVRHRHDMHPGEPVMSYEEFFRDRQQSRYATEGGKISRCC